MAGQNISHEGHRQRMRARVEQYGLESLAPHEALEYLLYITNARRDTNGIAHALLERFGSFAYLASRFRKLQRVKIWSDSTGCNVIGRNDRHGRKLPVRLQLK